MGQRSKPPASVVVGSAAAAAASPGPEEEEQNRLMRQLAQERNVNDGGPVLSHSMAGSAFNSKKSHHEDPHNFTVLSLCAFVLLGAVWGSAFTFVMVGVDPPFGIGSLEGVVVPAAAWFSWLTHSLSSLVFRVHVFRLSVCVCSRSQMANESFPPVRCCYWSPTPTALVPACFPSVGCCYWRTHSLLHCPSQHKQHTAHSSLW